MRAGRCLWMVLNAEGRNGTVLQPFDRVVVQIDVSNVDFVHVQTFRINSETMILRRNFHLLAFDVQDGMISTMMPEFQFERPPAECEPHNLMAQTNSKHRLPTEQSADILNRVVERLGITRTVRKKNSIRF